MLLPGDMASPFAGRSPEARAIGDLFSQTLLVCAVIFAIVTVLIAIIIVKFRARAGAAEPAQTSGHTRLEIAWTLIPVGIVALLFGLTARTMGAADPPADRPADLVVIAHQW